MAITKKRHVLITIVCAVGAFRVLQTITEFNKLDSATFLWYTIPYVVFSLLFGSLWVVGVWQMKKWGLMVYAGFLLTNQVISLLLGVWAISSLIMPAIVISIFAFRYNDFE